MKFRDILLILLVVFVWGVNFAAIKVGVGHFPPIFMTGLRFVLVAGVLVPFFRFPAAQARRILALSVVFGVVHFGAVFMGISGVDAAVAAITLQLGVPFTVFMAWRILGDRLEMRHMAGMALAILGVAVLAGEPKTASSLPHLSLLVISALAWGVANVQIKRIGQINPLRLTAWMAVFAAPQLLILSAVLERGQWQSVLNAGPTEWGVVLFAGLGSTVIGYGIWFYLVGRYEVSRIVPFGLLAPLIGVASGVLLLGEILTWQKVVGGLITVGGVAIIQLRWRRKESNRDKP